MVTENNVPNLDAMEPDDLMAFWQKTVGPHRKMLAVELFPNRPTHYLRTFARLGNYASNKATAMRCRLDGKIQEALMYERIAEGIYEQLPKWARW